MKDTSKKYYVIITDILWLAVSFGMMYTLRNSDSSFMLYFWKAMAIMNFIFLLISVSKIFNDNKVAPSIGE